LAEGDVGAGAPNLVGSWVAYSDGSGAAMLAPRAAGAALWAPAGREPALGGGQLLAGGNDTLLLARPVGRAVDLVALRCKRGASTFPLGGDAGAR
jgi:hypothetical protein